MAHDPEAVTLTSQLHNPSLYGPY